MRTVLALLLLAIPALSHVGSPDIFFEGQAGPYALFVTVRPPVVIPGVAEIEVRSTSPGVRQVRIVPLPLTGAGARFAPTPDVAQPSKEDPQFYTGSFWMMTSGSWQVRVHAEGAQGEGELSVPVPALATRTLTMQKSVGGLLLALGLILAVGLVSIVGASAREAQLEPGAAPSPGRIRRSRIVMAAAAVLVLALVWLGNGWWNDEAGNYRRYVYKPLQVSASVENGRLMLRLADPGWLNRKTDDLIPDHNHLMHLYVIRWPEMERVWHLHPERAGSGLFAQVLPEMPPGRYQLFGDIVHQNGLPETVTTEFDAPAVAGAPLTGDDAAGAGPPLTQADPNRTAASLPDGARMVWERDAAPLRTRRLSLFRFRIEDATGQPARDMELYMGMLGHAAFVAQDRSVFAHVHPSGSVPMASLGLVRPAAMDHSMHAAAGLPAEVTFPYGFPKAGNYRIFVQVKRAGKIETGVFDAKVEP